MLAIVCPGQGSQTAGFLAPWTELDGVADRLRSWSEVTGIDLLTHGTTSDEETIKDTAVAQPLIVAAGLISAGELGMEALPTEGWVAAGHSVGEVTAAALAGVLSEEQALQFVRVRATGMAEAAAAEDTGMAAVLGGDAEEVLATLERLELTPANVNGGGQTVAAGARKNIEALIAEPPAKTRVAPLKVAGAFHTRYMQPAVQSLADHASSLQPAEPQVRLFSNRDGAAVGTGREVLQRLVDQVTRPVRWDACQQALTEAGVTGILELLPGGTLSGLAKRELRGTPTLAVKSPDDLDAAREFMAEHASPALA